MAEETEEAWMEEAVEEKPNLFTQPATKEELQEPGFDAPDAEGELGMKEKEEGEEEPAATVRLGARAVKAPEEQKDWPAYDPTSPASEEPENVTDHVTATENAFLDDTEVATGLPARVGERIPRSTVAQGPPAIPLRQKKAVPCPILLVGKNLTKECLLQPGRWTEVGRHPKATVLMQNPAVSKRHCKLQWKTGSRSVELRVLDGVTHVNDKRLNSGSSVALKHGDLLKINGKGVSFRLMVNMQPVNSSLPDVRSMGNFAVACKELPPTRSPEEELRRSIRKLRAAAAAKRQTAIEYEERLTNVQTKRALRSKKMKEDIEQTHFLVKETEKLDGILAKSRDDWLERLQQQSELQNKAMAPLNEMTAATQTKLDSLKFLKDTYDRQLHPERHIQLASLKPPAVETSSPQKPNKYAVKPDEADGEDEAFADAPARGLGLPADKDEKIMKPTVEVLTKAKADNDIADLFGDFDSEEEEEQNAKRQRIE